MADWLTGWLQTYYTTTRDSLIRFDFDFDFLREDWNSFFLFFSCVLFPVSWLVLVVLQRTFFVGRGIRNQS